MTTRTTPFIEAPASDISAMSEPFAPGGAHGAMSNTAYACNALQETQGTFEAEGVRLISLAGFIGLLAIVPAFLSEIFLRLIARSGHQLTYLEVCRLTVQSMVNGTSPFKMALMLAAMAGLFVARSMTRGTV